MAGYLDQYLMTEEQRRQARANLLKSTSGHVDPNQFLVNPSIAQNLRGALDIPRQAGRNARGMLNDSVDAAGNYLNTVSPYTIGQNVGGAGRFLYDGVEGAVTPILTSIPGASKDAYDASADAIQGGGNFVRGVFGSPEDITQGERYSTGDTPVGDALNQVISTDVKGSLDELKAAATDVYAGISEQVSDTLTPQQVVTPETAALTQQPVVTPEAVAPVLSPNVAQAAALTQSTSGNPGQIFSADSARYTTPYNSVFPPNSSLGNNTPPINSRAVTMERMRDAALVDRSNTQSDNKRNNTSTNIPRTRIDLSEKLIRIGGAIMGGSNLGALNALQAGATEYGAIKDSGRNQLREDEALQLEYDKLASDRLAKRNTFSNAAEKANIANLQTANQYSDQIILFDKVLAGLDEFGDSVTGLYDGTVGSLRDNQSDDPDRARRAGLRSQMEQVTLDETLRNTAKTKGAITDKEMSLFKAPQPKMTDGEAKWKVYLTDRRNALVRIHNRLRDNIRVDFTTGSQINASGVNSPSVYSQSEQAALDKYTQ